MIYIFEVAYLCYNPDPDQASYGLPTIALANFKSREYTTAKDLISHIGNTGFPAGEDTWVSATAILAVTLKGVYAEPEIEVPKSDASGPDLKLVPT